MVATEDRACAYCGNPDAHVHSGTWECQACWYERKLDLPAARHWEKVAAEFLSNVDTWDLTKFLPAAGLSEDEMYTMLNGAKKVLEHSKSVTNLEARHARQELYRGSVNQ